MVAIKTAANDNQIINIGRSRITVVMTLAVACLSIYAALAGVLQESLYQEVLRVGTINHFLLRGSIAQDIVSIFLGIVLAVLSLVFLKQSNDKLLIAILGITGYFFYGYGLYVIQGMYTSIYLVYLIIFGLSIYSLIWGLISFDWAVAKDYQLSKPLRLTSGGFLIMILVVLVPVWFIRMMLDIARNIPGDVYGVFILDLAIEFPAFAIIAGQLFRNKSAGNLLAGVALFKVLTICLSVTFGEWYGAFSGGVILDWGMIIIFGLLTVISAGIIITYLRNLKLQSLREANN